MAMSLIFPSLECNSCHLHARRASIIISSNVEAKRILTVSDFGRGTILQDVFTGLLKHALFLLPQGPQWKKHRKCVQPAFGPVNIRYTLDVALEIMDKVSHSLDANIAASENGKKIVNAHALFAAIALDVMYSVLSFTIIEDSWLFLKIWKM